MEIGRASQVTTFGDDGREKVFQLSIIFFTFVAEASTICEKIKCRRRPQTVGSQR